MWMVSLYIYMLYMYMLAIYVVTPLIEIHFSDTGVLTQILLLL